MLMMNTQRLSEKRNRLKRDADSLRMPSPITKLQEAEASSAGKVGVSGAVQPCGARHMTSWNESGTALAVARDCHRKYTRGFPNYVFDWIWSVDGVLDRSLR